MDINSQAAELTAKLIEVSLKNTAQIIYNKINVAKQKNNDKATINALEEIINDLIADKNELIQITKCYEQEFVAQKISDSDIEFITELFPMLIGVSGILNQDEEKGKAALAVLGALLSPKTLKILQLLGFNYKEAIGIPLTTLVAQTIENQTDKIRVSDKSNGKNQNHKR